MKSKVLSALLAAVTLGYMGSALMPANVSASPVAGRASHGTFFQDRGVQPYFIHITVADILHNDPCGPNGNQTPVTTCPLAAIMPHNL